MIDRILYHIRQYFGFSRDETYGTLFLLLLITLALLMPYLLHAYDLYQAPDWVEDRATMP